MGDKIETLLNKDEGSDKQGCIIKGIFYYLISMEPLRDTTLILNLERTNGSRCSCLVYKGVHYQIDDIGNYHIYFDNWRLFNDGSADLIP